MIHYTIPEGIQPEGVAGRILLPTLQGGKVVIDSTLLTVWNSAGGRHLAEIIDLHKDKYEEYLLRTALACLAEAGLLQRDISPSEKVFSPCTGPLVSVVIVAYNSLEWLQECLPALSVQTYSPIETIVVDNASSDGCSDWLNGHYPDIKLVRIEAPQSFARATNIGIQAASGAYFFLLNPDVTLAADAVAQLVAVAEADPQCGAVGAKLRFLWAPSFLNGLGNRVGAFSWGTDNGLGHLDLGQFDQWEYLPSVCFAAALIPRQTWEKIGPIDERFPMYYEDTEWSYRARILGYPIRSAPKAVIYHAFGGRVPSGVESGLTPTKLRNAAYGRFRFSIKLLGSNLFRFLRNYLAEDWSNFSHHLVRGEWHMVRAYLSAWGDELASLPEQLAQRKSIQGKRVIDDQELFALQRDMPMTFAWHGLPELTWDLLENHYLQLISSGRTRLMPEFESAKRRPHLLIVSQDIVDVKMAGPGMRYLEMARALCADLHVTLAVPAETSLEIPGLRIVRYWEQRPMSLQVLVENSDIALVSGYMVEKFPFLENTATRLVVDLYDPFVLENLHYYLKEPREAQDALNGQAVAITNRLARLGDFFICGNERQRDYWMGVLTANNRTNPRNFTEDPTLRALLDIVGIGLPDREPVARPFLRGVDPRVPADARIVLWGGGIWNWLDPLTLIAAWPQVIAQYPQARLVFLGTRHPNPDVPSHEMAEKAQKLAKEIGEIDKSILFFEWIAYEDREALLSEAEVGVTLHPIHVETRYSLRTRVLDYLWAQLPVLITDGDVTSEWVRQYDLGAVVPQRDAQAVADGLNFILSRSKVSWQPNFTPLRESMRWSDVVKPLLHYCLESGYAPDRQTRQTQVEVSVPGTGSLLARARFILRTEGPRVLMHRAWRYFQWRMAR